MNYTIELSPNQKYFIIKITGKINLETIRQWSKELEKKSRSLKINRFLFDAREAQETSSITEMYHFAYNESVELNLQRNVRSAILVDEEDKSHNFVETAMRNAGYNVKIFRDELLAVTWVEEEIS